MLDLTIDAGRQTVTRAGAELHVPKLSFDLLIALLLRAAPRYRERGLLRLRGALRHDLRHRSQMAASLFAQITANLVRATARSH